jgi:hypothetical protein
MHNKVQCNKRRWHDFKARRAEVLNRYLKLKKKEVRCSAIIKLLVLMKIIKQMSSSYQFLYILKHDENKMRKFIQKLNALFILKIKRRGENVDEITKNKMRYSFGLLGVIQTQFE